MYGEYFWSPVPVRSMADSLSWPLWIDLVPFSNRMETSLLDTQIIQQSLLWRKDINRPWRIKQKTLLRCSHCWRVWYTHVSLGCSVRMLTETCAGCYRNTGRRENSAQGSERKLPRGLTWNWVWRDEQLQCLSACGPPRALCWSLLTNATVLRGTGLWGHCPHQWDLCLYDKDSEDLPFSCHYRTLWQNLKELYCSRWWEGLEKYAISSELRHLCRHQGKKSSP